VVGGSVVVGDGTVVSMMVVVVVDGTVVVVACGRVVVGPSVVSDESSRPAPQAARNTAATVRAVR
jgi:hypothetical protein